MKFWSVGKFFIAGGIPLTASLGVWQLKRQEWKTQLIQKYEDRPVMEPLEGIPLDFLESDEYEFRRMKLSGHYDHTKELYIAPRSYIPTKHELKRRRVDSELTHSRLGVHIITAFELQNGERILVNRGFASWEYQFPDKRLEGQIENSHEICGIIRVDDETLLDKKRKKNGVEGGF